MRDIIFRAKRTDNGEWVEGSLLTETHDIAGNIEKRCKISDITYGQDDEGFATYMSGVEEYVDPDTVCEWTGLYDKSGKKIFEGDVLRFDDNDGVWQSSVVFERGLFGLDVYSPKQIKNPDGWDMKHNRVKSRWWGSRWGYEEFGTAFTYRKPLAIATTFNGTPEEYQNSEIHKWHEEHGFGKYVVWSEVIGNVFDNPDLIER